MRQFGIVTKLIAAKVPLFAMSAVLVLMALASATTIGNSALILASFAIFAFLSGSVLLLSSVKPRLQPVRTRRRLR